MTGETLSRAIVLAATGLGSTRPAEPQFVTAADQIKRLEREVTHLTITHHPSDDGKHWQTSGEAVFPLGDREYGGIANVRGQSIAEVIGQLHALIPPQTG